MSLKFLNLKGWHPSNKTNQKRIWIAEQKAKAKEQKEKDAATELRKAADFHHYQQIAATKGDADAMRRMEAQQVGFLYAPPPGLQKVDEKAASDMTEDDAVREFRRKMEQKNKKSSSDEPREMQRNLERYVGRRPNENLTIKDQVERFPFLKDAPVEGDYTDSVKVNFKPMGVQLRNVKCLRCGQWGHLSGDRECQLRNFNPHDAARQAMEDPMSYMNKLNHTAKQDLVLRKAVLPLELQGEEAAGEYEILPSDGDSSDPEQEFLASLSTKEKKLLLKKLKKQSRESKRNKSSSTESSSSSDSESDSFDGSSRHHRKQKRDAKKKKKRKKHKKDRKRELSPERHRDRQRTDEEQIRKPLSNTYQSARSENKSNYHYQHRHDSEISKRNSSGYKRRDRSRSPSRSRSHTRKRGRSTHHHHRSSRQD